MLSRRQQLCDVLDNASFCASHHVRLLRSLPACLRSLCWLGVMDQAASHPVQS